MEQLKKSINFKRNMKFNIAALIVFLGVSSSQNHCDDAYGAHCPEASGWDVGVCLKKLDSSALTPPCSNFIAFHDACIVSVQILAIIYIHIFKKDDINAHCSGKEYTGDVLPCMTEWTKPDVISANCLENFPKKEIKEKGPLSAEAKRKADQRRK